MKKILALFFCFYAMCSHFALAQHMVVKENLLKDNLKYIGLPDYPPFAWYENDSLKGVFIEPTIKTMKKYGFDVKEEIVINRDLDFKNLMLDIRSGKSQIFFGAYSDSKMFTGIQLIYPAVVSNPIHIITLPNTKDKIKSSKDLVKLKGIAIKTEYFNDFVMRKIKPLNLEFVDSPNEAYEKLFVGDADYIFGSLYYNKIMASRIGIEQYLSYSKKPIFKIPVFVALSKITPLLSLYEKAFSDEFSKPEFALEIKKEILRIVDNEVNKSIGVVPPTFAKEVIEQTEAETLEPVADIGADTTEDLGGKIIEKDEKQKTIDEVLDGI